MNPATNLLGNRVATLALLALAWPASAAAAEPRVLVDDYSLQRIAAAPQVVTPVGVAFDRQGRLLVVESHTHQRPDDYDGPAGDRILIASDSNGDGQLDSWGIFAEGFRHAMNVAIHPDGAVYIVTRSAVHLLRDKDDDGRADSDQKVVRLETDQDYPHNGLSGIVFDGQGRMYLGLGENFGGLYRLVGSDGSTIEDAGGSATVFLCDDNGGNLQHYAIGFWNPFSLCFAGERLFCVDNDPDASPPCRLIDVVEGGDYGHRWEYGRAGVHPLQAWDGELPGTLPMVCGTGEAPTAVLFHRGWLWVTSWGDHRIERYALTPREDGSYSAVREVVVQGDPDFRPTGMAVAPDGSLYFADWVDRSYPVHGKGRIWRLAIGVDKNLDAPPLEAAPKLEQRLRQTAAGQDESSAQLDQLQVQRWRAIPLPASQRKQRVLLIGSAALQDGDGSEAQLMTVRWIAENRVDSLRDEVAALLDGEIPNERFFLAVLGALEWLDGDGSPRSAGISDELLVRELANPTRSPQLRAIALRLLSPDHKWLTTERLQAFLEVDDPGLQREAVDSLALRWGADATDLLAEISDDASRPVQLRADAIAGLASAADDQQALLKRLAQSNQETLAREAARVLRLAELQQSAPQHHPPADDADAWNQLLDPAAGGDARSGRRLFFSTVGPRCGVCHQHGGRGGRIGPDLTHIGRRQSRQRIIDAILRPSEEIAPRFQPWTLLTDAGRTLTGLKMPQGGDNGQETYADGEGHLVTLRSDQIKLRQASDVSVMPSGLQETVSLGDLRDLIAFLTAPEN